VALSGLAEARYRLIQDEYIAGLWMSELKAQLLWSVDHHHIPTAESRLSIAPTWSWASTTSSIKWYTYVAQSEQLRVLSTWKILSVVDKGSKKQPFAPTIRAMISIDGLLTRVQNPRFMEGYIHSYIEPQSQDVHGLSDVQSQACRLEVRWDTDRTTYPSYMLFVTTLQENLLRGLLLVPCPGTNCFERVAYCYVESLGVYNIWKKNLVRQKFHIL
jgi:hypothetical protein